MMGKLTRVIGVMVIMVLALTACASDDEGELPTLMPDMAQEEEAPPTEAPSEPDAIPTATEQPRTRPTLPPTWTPTPLPSMTPTPLPPPTQDPANAGSQSEILASCGEFGPVSGGEEISIRVGETPEIVWRAVPEAGLYRLYIFDETGFMIHQWIGEETTYTPRADLFTTPSLYGWEVEPLDPQGIQICPGRGGLINARQG